MQEKLGNPNDSQTEYPRYTQIDAIPHESIKQF